MNTFTAETFFLCLFVVVDYDVLLRIQKYDESYKYTSNM